MASRYETWGEMLRVRMAGKVGDEVQVVSNMSALREALDEEAALREAAEDHIQDLEAEASRAPPEFRRKNSYGRQGSKQFGTPTGFAWQEREEGGCSSGGAGPPARVHPAAAAASRL